MAVTESTYPGQLSAFFSKHTFSPTQSEPEPGVPGKVQSVIMGPGYSLSFKPGRLSEPVARVCCRWWPFTVAWSIRDPQVPCGPSNCLTSLCAPLAVWCPRLCGEWLTMNTAIRTLCPHWSRHPVIPLRLRHLQILTMRLNQQGS